MWGGIVWCPGTNITVSTWILGTEKPYCYLVWPLKTGSLHDFTFCPLKMAAVGEVQGEGVNPYNGVKTRNGPLVVLLLHFS